MSYSTLPFAALVKEVLSPVVRADGFKGSRGKYHRVCGDLVHVLSLQTMRTGGSLTVNLAVHPLGIPDTIGRPVDPKTIGPESCDFWRRLTTSNQDQWWPYQANEESLRAALSQVVETYLAVGRSLFEPFAVPVTPFHTVTPAQLEGGADMFFGFNTTLVRKAFLLARFRRLQGQVQDARMFAALALAHLGAASILRSELEAILATG